MSTSSYIAMKDAVGYVAVYCHWDGYPTWNGLMLVEHYQERTKVALLLDLGTLSSLNPELGHQHDFRNPTKGWTVAYGRDRGDDGAEPQRFDSLEELWEAANECDAEWLYVLPDGADDLPAQWLCGDVGGGMRVGEMKLLPVGDVVREQFAKLREETRKARN